MKTKNEALQQVRDNNKSDYLSLYSFASAWVKTMMKPFTSEDLKLAYEELNERPRQPNIYGAAMNALSHDKLIKHNGYTTAKLPSAHGRVIHEWISMEYSNKQSANRSRPVEQVNLFDLTL